MVVLHLMSSIRSISTSREVPEMKPSDSLIKSALHSRNRGTAYSSLGDRAYFRP